MSDAIRRNMALFPMRIVMQLTDLSARQIRYYEQHELVKPVRTDSNQRLFSFNDVERLLEIKKHLEKGINIAGIKRMIHQAADGERMGREPSALKRQEPTDPQLHRLLKQQLNGGNRPDQVSLNQGDISTYFKR